MLEDSKIMTINELKMDLIKVNDEEEPRSKKKRASMSVHNYSNAKKRKSLAILQQIDEGLQLNEIDCIDKIIDKMMIHICCALTYYQQQVDSYILALRDNSLTWRDLLIQSQQAAPSTGIVYGKDGVFRIKNESINNLESSGPQN